jgi:DNA-directed RNA polymerase III subunit RPC1
MKGTETEKISAVSINHHFLYGENSNEPNIGGPLDKRLGTSLRTRLCETCGQNMTDCPGHFGNIRLTLPVFHVGFFKQTLNILQTICKSCSALQLKLTDRERMLGKSFKNIIDECRKMKHCYLCGSYNGTVRERPGEKLKIVHDKF